MQSSFQRDPLIQTLLSLFIPFYILYWMHVTAKHIERTYRHKAPSLWLLVAPVIMLVVSVILIMASGSLALDASSILIVILLLALFFIVLPLSLIISAIYFWKFSVNAENVLGPEASKVLLVILFLFIAPIATYIVQDKLNQLEEQLAQAQKTQA